MRYKSKVLAKHPSARLITVRYHDDLMTSRYQSVIAGPTWEALVMDINNPDTRWQQGAAAAWRSAYYWGVRENRKQSEILAHHNRMLEA